MIYFDYHTAKKPFPQAAAEMDVFYTEKWGSPRSPNQKGSELHIDLKNGLKKIFRSLGASAEWRLFPASSGAAACAHLFLNHYIDFIRKTGRTQIITSKTEDAPIAKNIRRLEDDLGCGALLIDVGHDGRINLQKLEESIKARTSLISLSLVNPHSGVIQDYEKIARICQEKNILLHFDLTYAIGKLDMHIDHLGADFITFDGSIIGAPVGTGALLVKKKHPFNELVLGDHQLNTPGVMALSTALEITTEQLPIMGMEVARKRAFFEEKITQEIPSAKPLFDQAERVANTSVITFENCDSDMLLFKLDRKKLYASIGGGHVQKLSHFLGQCGFEPKVCNCSLAFQFSSETADQEIEEGIAIIKECVEAVRAISKECVEGN